MNTINNRSSKELSDEYISVLKVYNDTQWFTVQELISLVNLESLLEFRKINRVIEILIFRQVIEFNEGYLLWENKYFNIREVLKT